MPGRRGGSAADVARRPRGAARRLPAGVGRRARAGGTSSCCWSSGRAASARPGSSTRWRRRASATGGLVLRGRCHPAERSLFLQPFVDALRPAARGAAARHDLLTAVRDHEAAWASLVPDLGPVLRGAPAPPADRDLAAPRDVRRRARGVAPAVRHAAAGAGPRRPAGRRCRHGRPARLPGRPADRVAGPAGRRPSAARTPPWPSGWATAPGSSGCGPWMPPRSTRSRPQPGWRPTAGR